MFKQLIERLRNQPRPQPKRNRSRTNFFASAALGGFAGGKSDRLTDDWRPGQLTASTIHRMDAKVLRNRARDLVANHPLAKSGVDAYIANVIECGITPKPLFDDGERRRDWVNTWNQWGGERGKPDADITRQQHIYELMALWLEEIIVGGGCLVHYRVLDRRTTAARSRTIPLSLELIPEERFVDDRDDFVISRNRNKGKNPIVRGVEIETSTGEPVAYWIRNEDFVTFGVETSDPTRLPADQCEYSFFRKRIGQYRGITLLHAAVMWLWKLGYYTDNELMASAIKSCYSVLIKTSPEDMADFPDLFDGDPDGPVTDSFGNTMEKIQPGMIARLTVPGDITGVGPNVPTSDTIGWVRFIERSISIAINLSYEEVTRDYTQGNFSQSRAGANADRKRFRPMQKFTINHFCMPTYRRFAQWASMRGIDGFPTIDDFVANMDQWLQVKWRTPGWASVNPWDDARAAVLEVQNGMGTRETYLAAKGDDWEDTFDQLEREDDGANERDLTLGGTPNPQEQSIDSVDGQ